MGCGGLDDEDFKKAFYKGACGVLIIYDVTKQDTFEHVLLQLEEVRDYADPYSVIILIGDKTDLKEIQVVNSDEARYFAEKEGLLFIEASALENTNVEMSFRMILEKIFGLINEMSSAEPELGPDSSTDEGKPVDISTKDSGKEGH